MSTENVILLKNRLDEVLYDLVDGELVDSARYHLCAGGCCGSGDSCCGCVVPFPVSVLHITKHPAATVVRGGEMYPLFVEGLLLRLLLI